MLKVDVLLGRHELYHEPEGVGVRLLEEVLFHVDGMVGAVADRLLLMSLLDDDKTLSLDEDAPDGSYVLGLSIPYDVEAEAG